MMAKNSRPMRCWLSLLKLKQRELAMAQKRSFLATLAAIAWSFIGLRRKRDFDVDAEGAFNPLYVFIAALVALAAFIGALMLAVRFAVA